jgi:transcriptional regulator
MRPFDTPPPELVASLVRAQPLALLISGAPGRSMTTPLPLIATRTAADGTITEFEGHIARRNPHTARLEEDPAALLIFQGPNRYIPAAAVTDAAWAPTWNYAIAQFEVEIMFTPEATRASVERLLDRLDPHDWRPATRIPERYEAMLRQIVAFRAQVTRASAKFKLGQDERPAAFDDIVGWLGDDPLATWMRQARDAR